MRRIARNPPPAVGAHWAVVLPWQPRRRRHRRLRGRQWQRRCCCRYLKPSHGAPVPLHLPPRRLRIARAGDCCCPRRRPSSPRVASDYSAPPAPPFAAAAAPPPLSSSSSRRTAAAVPAAAASRRRPLALRAGGGAAGEASARSRRTCCYALLFGLLQASQYLLPYEGLPTNRRVTVRHFCGRKWRNGVRTYCTIPYVSTINNAMPNAMQTKQNKQSTTS